MSAPRPKRSMRLDYHRPSGRRGTSLALWIGGAGIAIGVLGVLWNLASILGVFISYRTDREAAQDRAAAQQALEAEREGRPLPVLIPAPSVPPPTSLMVGVGLCVAVFILNMTLAVILVGAAGLLLRDSPRAWPLHRLYIHAKLPAAVLAGAAWAWMFHLQRGEHGLTAEQVVWIVVIVLLGCAWPVTLALVMRQARPTDAGGRGAA